MKILNEAKVAQDDPRLIKVIKDQYIEAPSKLPYNLENWDMQDYSKLGMSPEADDHLNKNVRTISTVQTNKTFERNMEKNSSASIKTYVVGTQKNRLISLRRLF